MNTEGETILEDALVMVHLRNAFYRGKFRFALGLYVLSLLANILLISIIIYWVKHPTQPLFFPADKVGRLVQEVPLQKPNMPTQNVADWAVEAVEAAYSYDFVNYHGQLQNAQKYFTDYGWRTYMKALAISDNFLALTERKYIIIAKVVAPPKLLVEGPLAGAIAWKFEMPMLVTYLQPPFNFNDPKSTFSNPLIVTVIVQRQNILQSYQGLGVLQLIANIPINPIQNPSQ